MYGPPENAVVLFDGTGLDQWTGRRGGAPTWRLENGTMITAGEDPVTDDIVSKQKFTDSFVHLEFMIPDMPDATGQAKGNSGVFMQGRYEIQILDSYGIEVPGTGDCAGVWAQFAPIVNACRPPLEWQTYDIVFRAPRFDDSGEMLSNARISLVHNGQVALNNVEVTGVAPAGLDENVAEPGPLVLQYHGDAVSFRNVWAVPLPLEGSSEF